MKVVCEQKSTSWNVDKTIEGSLAFVRRSSKNGDPSLSHTIHQRCPMDDCLRWTAALRPRRLCQTAGGDCVESRLKFRNNRDSRRKKAGPLIGQPGRKRTTGRKESHSRGCDRQENKSLRDRMVPKTTGTINVNG